MLLVSGKEIKSSISMLEAIDCVAKGFSDFNDGLFRMPQRTIMDIEGATVLTMPSYRKNGEYFVIKVVTVFDQFSIKKDKMVDSSVLVFDSKNGNLLAKLDGDSITAIRTGAASGIATKYFSSPSLIFNIMRVPRFNPVKEGFILNVDLGSGKIVWSKKLFISKEVNLKKMGEITSLLLISDQLFFTTKNGYFFFIRLL